MRFNVQNLSYQQFRLLVLQGMVFAEIALTSEKFLPVPSDAGSLHTFQSMKINKSHRLSKAVTLVWQHLKPKRDRMEYDVVLFRGDLPG